MSTDVATYSYRSINECIEAVKEFDWTVTHKNEHPWKCAKVEELFDFLREKTGYFGFDVDSSPAGLYRKAISRNATNREMVQALKNCEYFVKNELNEIHSMMICGEVNSVE